MDKEKQIEEIKNIIYFTMCEPTSGFPKQKVDMYVRGYRFGIVADALYDKGYRKQSDTARDIIKDILWTVENCTKGYLREHLRELAEKYGVKID